VPGIPTEAAVKAVLFYQTAPDVAATAPAHYAAHSARARSFHDRGSLLMIGTFSRVQEDGAMGVFTSREAAEEFATADPFVVHGVVRSWDVRDWNETLFAPEAASVHHIGVSIERRADDVYEFASDPMNLPRWAAGLGASGEQVNGTWVAESPMGRIVVAFTPRNELGVLDHDVTLPSGETVRNRMRVLADGESCDVVFTLRRRPGVSDQEFSSDRAAVIADLATLKHVLEGNPTR
jgi:uncharacterized protein YciI